MCVAKKYFLCKDTRGTTNDPLMFKNKAEQFYHFTSKQFYGPMNFDLFHACKKFWHAQYLVYGWKHFDTCYRHLFAKDKAIAFARLKFLNATCVIASKSSNAPNRNIRQALTVNDYLPIKYVDAEFAYFHRKKSKK